LPSKRLWSLLAIAWTGFLIADGAVAGEAHSGAAPFRGLAQDGLGAGFVPPSWRPADGVEGVTFREFDFAHALDDGYDEPFGYGEYAQYGPWAHRAYGRANCRLVQWQVRMARRPRWRASRVCG
jgi:hypothetical protein